MRELTLEFCPILGFVFAMESGSSTCLHVATISKALVDLARGLDVGLRVTKTGRMSGPGERAADALSKSDFSRAWEDIGNVREKTKRMVPKCIRDWVSDPVPDPELGLRILEELRGQENNLMWEKVRLTARDLRKGAETSMREGKKARAAMMVAQKKDRQRMKRLRERAQLEMKKRAKLSQ